MAEDNGTAGRVVDLSNQDLTKLSSLCHSDITTLILDHTGLVKLEHLDKWPHLEKLSVVGNHLVHLGTLRGFSSLRVLNLAQNSISTFHGLDSLSALEWLSLAANNVKTIDVKGCHNLLHLDLSDNNISQLGQLSHLSKLKSLLLHGNAITTLHLTGTHLPRSLTILSLAENEIRDLAEVSYLSSLAALVQLSLMKNPCVQPMPGIPSFDHRPYVLTWCLGLRVLDGISVGQKESLKSEWLYSQGKGRIFHPGHHAALTSYLAAVCPLVSAMEQQVAEDAKLEKILNHRWQHEKELVLEKMAGKMPVCSAVQNVTAHTACRPSTSPALLAATPASYQVNVGGNSAVVHSEVSVPKASGTSTIKDDQVDVQNHCSNLPAITRDGALPTSLLEDPFKLPLSSKLATQTFVCSPWWVSPSCHATSLGSSNELMLLSPENILTTGGPTATFVVKKDETSTSLPQLPPFSFSFTMNSEQPFDTVVAQRNDVSLLNPEVTFGLKTSAERTTKCPGIPSMFHSIPQNSSVVSTIQSQHETQTSRFPQLHLGKYGILSTTFGNDSEVSTGTGPPVLCVESTPAGKTSGEGVQDEKPSMMVTYEAKGGVYDRFEECGVGLHKRVTEDVFLGKEREPSSDSGNEDLTAEHGLSRIRHSAAVAIQAWWRGCRARAYEAGVRDVRLELRLRRMQQHIIELERVVHRLSVTCAQERRERLVHADALKVLWSQVQMLTSWRTDVSRSCHECPTCSSLSSTLAECSFASTSTTIAESSGESITTVMGLPMKIEGNFDASKEIALDKSQESTINSDEVLQEYLAWVHKQVVPEEDSGVSRGSKIVSDSDVSSTCDESTLTAILPNGSPGHGGETASNLDVEQHSEVSFDCDRHD
uniref:centrosomal protein of 97 kDa n=1 Tax=Myxine glutinosa TaxID=7769 RepID=UPI00358F49B3